MKKILIPTIVLLTLFAGSAFATVAAERLRVYWMHSSSFAGTADFTVRIDPETGCQYLMSREDGYRGALSVSITPRLRANGTPMCGAPRGAR